MIREEIKKELKKITIIPADINFSLHRSPKNFSSDFSSNILLIVSKIMREKPEGLFEKIFGELSENKAIEKVEFSKPGFINFTLSRERLHAEIESILSLENKYPLETLDIPEPVIIDFVSSNPTGPLHIGHVRGTVIGDTISRILRHFGCRVVNEYYVNDTGKQIGLLLESVRARIKQLKDESAEFPENGYKGEYINQLAEEFSGKEITQGIVVEKILEIIKKDLLEFRVTFDSWAYESSLHKSKMVDGAIKTLSEKGYIYYKDGAYWFKSTSFGDEKDRPVKKTEGGYTYLAADIAYHLNKIQRGNKLLINIWGHDHHGYVKRLSGAIKALGYDEKMLKVILYQLVSLLRSGQRVKMSTRTGEFITLREVIDEIGVDATRYFLATRTPEAQLEFDLDVAKKQSPENPVYYIQYAHTRCAGILREAQNLQMDTPGANPDLSLLKEKKERALILELLFYPEALYSCIMDYTPHHLTSYLLNLAGLFHNYYDSFRVITKDEYLSRSRITLVKAVKIVIKNGLTMLGITSPDKM